jgi:hypothetical protein
MKNTDPGPKAGGALHALAVVVPVVACLFCPICLPAGLGMLSVVGVGLSLGDDVHHALIVVSVVAALVSAAVLTRRHRNPGPGLLTIVGGAAVAAGCLWLDIAALEYCGTGLLVTAAIWNWRLRRRRLPVLFRIHKRPLAAPRTP